MKLIIKTIILLISLSLSAAQADNNIKIPYFESQALKEKANLLFDKANQMQQEKFKHGSPREMLKNLREAATIGHPESALRLCAVLGNEQMGIAMWREGLAWCHNANNISKYLDIKNEPLITENINNMVAKLPEVHKQYANNKLERIKETQTKLLVSLEK